MKSNFIIRSVLAILSFTIFSYGASAETVTLKCTGCGGTGSNLCIMCLGYGATNQMRMLPYPPFNIWYELVTCGACSGSGKVACLGCHGSGSITMNIDPNYSNYNNNYNNSSYYNSGGSSSPSQNSSSSSSQHWCGVCKGTGSMTKSWYVNSNYETYCNTCKQKFYHGHSHVTCTSCNGKGYW